MVTFAEASAFIPIWVGMLDEGAEPSAFLKYLPDGPFEEWSYPTAEIVDTEALLAYFDATFAMFTSNDNDVRTQTVTRVDGGRYEIVADATWTGVRASGDTVVNDIRYSITIGPGTAQADPTGDVPKVYRYKIRPIG